MRVVIETERLIIRPVAPEEYEACFKWCGDPEVNTYLIYPVYKKAEDVRTWLEGRNIDDPDNYDLGFELKESGELVGMGGLVYDSDKKIWKLGYNLRKDCWGNGYVPEAMNGIIEHIQRVRELKVLEGEFAKENSKSKRVMEKLGMIYNRDSEYTKLDGSRTFKSEVYRREWQ